jgi:basic membrane lipoprotein Med (substrate-binding protein (PBP1-ABC) superfamily)
MPVTNGSILSVRVGTTSSTFRDIRSATILVRTTVMMDGVMIIAGTTGTTGNGVVTTVVSIGEAGHDY